MAVQLSLIQDDRIKKTILTVPIGECVVSPFNPRASRPDEEINKLAQRMARNGFEITRALWAYRNGHGYEVFAGGTRLEAARRAALAEIPVILHEGLTDEEKVRLAEQDNENDEYHTEISPVDEWAHYAWLADQEWTQERIAKAKGVTQAMVSYRLALNNLPVDIKAFITQGDLEETHLREILSLSLELYFSRWLTTEQAQRYLVWEAVNDRKKNGSKSVRAFSEDVARWKEFIAYAEQVYQSLPESIELHDLNCDPPQIYPFAIREKFVSALEGARSLVKVKAAEQFIRSFIADDLNAYRRYVETESSVAALAAQKTEKESQLLSRFMMGDCLNCLKDWKLGKIKVVLTDPPYGKDYQSNRRWRTSAPKKIAGDTEEEAIQLLQSALSLTLPNLSDDAHVLVFCDWQHEPQVRQVLTDLGLTLKGSLIWVKEEHSAGDVKGAFAPRHERIVHAVKGSPEVTPRIPDVIECSRSRATNHPTEKPVELLKKLVNSTSCEGELVIDPFAGCASTLLAALQLKREFWGTELDPKYHDEGSARLLEEFEKQWAKRAG